jgi:hypothetical protein
MLNPIHLKLNLVLQRNHLYVPAKSKTMKTTLFKALAISIFLFAVSITEKADAQKPKTKTDKIIIRSSDSEPLEIENLRDTIIISKDGKDTTIIKTMQDGKEKKVTVRKVITSGNTDESMHWVEAETETLEKGEGEEVIVKKSKKGEPRTIYIEKRITKGDTSDSISVNGIRLKELPGDEDILLDEPAGKKYKTVTVITSDGKRIEKEGDENTTVIYITDDSKCRHHKVKKGKKHQKVYIIEEEKTINKEE